MTLREVVDLSLLAKSVPDEKTTKNNMEFLQNAAQKMEKADQQKTIADQLNQIYQANCY